MRARRRQTPHTALWLALLCVSCSAHSAHGAWPTPAAAPGVVLSDSVSAVSCADVDGDNLNDVVFSTDRGTALHWLPNAQVLAGGAPPLRSVYEPSPPLPYSWHYVFSSCTADFDGDSTLDIVTASKQQNEVRLYLNGVLNGTFDPSSVRLVDHGSDAPNGPRNVLCDDVDGDGFPDIVVFSQNAHSVSVYRNVDGRASFAPRRVVASGLGLPTSMALLPSGELIVASRGRGEVILLRPTAVGEYNASVLIRANSSEDAFAPEGVAVGDLDGNGVLDAVVAAYDLGAVVWFPNAHLSNRLLNDGVTVASGHGSPTGLALADADADGDLDVAVAWYSSSTVTVHNNDGAGNFIETRVLSGAGNEFFASAIVACTLDADGQIDWIASSQYSTSEAVLYRNVIPSPASPALLSPRVLKLVENSTCHVAVSLSPLVLMEVFYVLQTPAQFSSSPPGNATAPGQIVRGSFSGGVGAKLFHATNQDRLFASIVLAEGYRGVPVYVSFAAISGRGSAQERVSDVVMTYFINNGAVAVQSDATLCHITINGASAERVMDQAGLMQLSAPLPCLPTELVLNIDLPHASAYANITEAATGNPNLLHHCLLQSLCTARVVVTSADRSRNSTTLVRVLGTPPLVPAEIFFNPTRETHNNLVNLWPDSRLKFLRLRIPKTCEIPPHVAREMRLTGSVELQFNSSSALLRNSTWRPGSEVVVVRNAPAFRSHFAEATRLIVAQWTSGDFDPELGNPLELRLGSRLLWRVTLTDLRAAPWFSKVHGGGRSAVSTDGSISLIDMFRNWRPHSQPSSTLAPLRSFAEGQRIGLWASAIPGQDGVLAACDDLATCGVAYTKPRGDFIFLFAEAYSWQATAFDRVVQPPAQWSNVRNMDVGRTGSGAYDSIVLVDATQGVAWLESQPDGTFTAHYPQQAESVVEDIDLVVLCPGGRTIVAVSSDPGLVMAWTAAQGSDDPLSGGRVDVAQGEAYYAVVCGQLNDDDDDLPDIVVLVEDSNNVTYFLHDSGNLGHFLEHSVTVDAGMDSHDTVRLADVDGDGHLDILVGTVASPDAEEYSDIAYLHNRLADPAHNDISGEARPIANVYSNYEFCVVERDLVYISQSARLDASSVVVVPDFNADGAFSVLESRYYELTALRCGDVDGDGHDDVLVTIAEDEVVWVPSWNDGGVHRGPQSIAAHAHDVEQTLVGTFSGGRAVAVLSGDLQRVVLYPSGASGPLPPYLLSVPAVVPLTEQAGQYAILFSADWHECWTWHEYSAESGALEQHCAGIANRARVVALYGAHFTSSTSWDVLAVLDQTWELALFTNVFDATPAQQRSIHGVALAGIGAVYYELVGSFDEEPLDDLIVVNASGMFAVLSGNTGQQVPFPHDSDRPVSGLARLESSVLVARRSSGALWLYAVNGTRMSLTSEIALFLGDSVDIVFLTVGRVDDDEFLDIVFSMISGDVFWMRGTSTGTLQGMGFPRSIRPVDPASSPYSLTVLDTDSDNRGDLVTDYHVYHANSLDFFERSAISNVESGDWTRVFAARVSHATRSDVIAWRRAPRPSALLLFRSTGDDTIPFEDGETIYTFSSPDWSVDRVTVADCGGGPAADIVVVQDRFDTVAILWNNGDGSFSEPDLLFSNDPAMLGPRHAHVIQDMSSPSSPPSLVVCAFRRVAWLRGLGDKQFADPETVWSEDAKLTTTALLNDDSFPDLIVAISSFATDFSDPVLIWMRGLGSTGPFDATQRSLGVSADFVGDLPPAHHSFEDVQVSSGGKVLVALMSDDRIFVIVRQEASPEPHFGTPRLLTQVDAAIDKPIGIVLANLIGEESEHEKEDLLIMCEGTDRVVWLEHDLGEGGEPFTGVLRTANSGGGSIRGIAAGDVSGDNRADVVFYGLSRPLTWVQNALSREPDSSSTIACDRREVRVGPSGTVSCILRSFRLGISIVSDPSNFFISASPSSDVMTPGEVTLTPLEPPEPSSVFTFSLTSTATGTISVTHGIGGAGGGTSLLFYRAAPIIVEHSLRLVLGVGGQDGKGLVEVADPDPVLVSLGVQNLVDDTRFITVFFGPESNVRQFQCVVVAVFVDQDMLECELSNDGYTSEPLFFEVHVAGAPFPSTADQFNFVQFAPLPQVSRVSGCDDDEDGGAGTRNCPLEGGRTLTVHGDLFDETTTILIGSRSCTRLTLSAPSNITCRLPRSGGGSALVTPVSITANLTQIHGAPKQLVSYAIPEVLWLFGCNGTQDGDSIHLVECDRTARQTITITGSSFGPASEGMRVTVGGEACGDLGELVTPVRGELQPNETLDAGVRLRSLTCTLPVNALDNQPLSVIDVSGRPSLSGALVSFVQCEPGTFLHGVECRSCPPGTFQDGVGRTSCKPCAEGSFTNQTRAQACEQCPRHSIAPDPGSVACEECPPLQYTEGEQRRVCESCPQSKYVRFFGERDGDETSSGQSCLGCPSGAKCDGSGAVIARDNVWVYEERGSGTIHSLLCVPGRCEQCSEAFVRFASLQGHKAISCCSENRLSAAENPMCGQCASGHVEWGGECVDCSSGANYLLISGLIALFWLFVAFSHFALYQHSNPNTGIMMYFIQMVGIIFTTNTGWLRWAGFLDFNPLFSASGGSCVADWSPVTKLLVSALTPLLSWFFLALTALVHRVCKCGYGRGDRREDMASMREFLTPYWRSSIALFLYTYNNVANSSLRFFECVTIGDDQFEVVRSLPDIDCTSDEYKRARPVFLALIVVFVVCGPLLIMLWLYRTARDDDHDGKRERQEQFSGPKRILYELFRGRTMPIAHYWSAVVLVRRVMVVAVSVLMTRTGHATRYASLTLAHMLVLLVHLYVRPFRDVTLQGDFVDSEEHRAALRKAGVWLLPTNEIESVSLLLLAAFSSTVGATELPFSTSQSIGFATAVHVWLVFLVGLMLYRLVAKCCNRLRRDGGRSKAGAGAGAGAGAREVAMDPMWHNHGRDDGTDDSDDGDDGDGVVEQQQQQEEEEEEEEEQGDVMVEMVAVSPAKVVPESPSDAALSMPLHSSLSDLHSSQMGRQGASEVRKSSSGLGHEIDV